MTDFVKNDEYEDFASGYQVFLIHWLNTALKRSGIEDLKKRKEIITEYFRDMSTWTDQYWYEASKSKKVYPCISFSTEGPAFSKDAAALGKVYLPSSQFLFDEYLGGNLHHYFEELKEDVTKLATGRTK